ncbi:hypothetical protein HY250_04755 [Candidatus Azambacteria bacterium]|nr:hypothetical protein [Candidatus Azambacteria bacterium]
MEGVMEAALQVVTYACDTPGCAAKELPREMWSLDKRATKGKRVIVCRDCRRLAHQEGVKSYRLDYTLKWEAEQQNKRKFFKTFATVVKHSGNGNGDRR